MGTDLIQEAKRILDVNWRGSYTVPSSSLYPHQWNWDSAFISIGYARYDQKRAQTELMSLMEGQWKNGMLPHIIFRSEGSYFPGPDFWQTMMSRNVPAAQTSGITQPPVHAISALRVYEKASDREEAAEFLEQIYPRILDFHRYLLTSRDPEQSGLVTIFHPWESGTDNSPRWDPILKRVPAPAGRYERKDTRFVATHQRPTNEYYDRAVYLIEMMRKYQYNDQKIYENTPFKAKDAVFSAILYMANKDLLKIAGILGRDTEEIEEWTSRTERGYSRYLMNGSSAAHDYDLVLEKQVEKNSVASLIPLCTDLISRQQARDIVDSINESYTSNSCHEHGLIMTLPAGEKEHSSHNYWRGPIWINMNWLLYRGMLSHGFSREAVDLRNSMINMVENHGFYEYYDPHTGNGLGIKDFSWTASLLIDLIQNQARHSAGLSG